MQRKTYHEVIPIARPTNFVAPDTQSIARQRELPAYAPRHEIAHAINVPLSATQHIEERSTPVLRAQAFLLRTVPLYAAFALGAVLIGVLFFAVPFWSFWSFCIFWLSFVLAWLVAFKIDIDRSPEGISLYEARSKWDVIREEQRRRWEHYDRLIEGGE